MSLAFDQNALESPLKEVADPVVTLIETLGILLIQPFHPARKPYLGCLDEKVVVIRHQNPGMQDPSPLGDHLRQQRHEAPAIGVIAEDVAPLVAAACDMPDGTDVHPEN